MAKQHIFLFMIFILLAKLPSFALAENKSQKSTSQIKVLEVDFGNDSNPRYTPIQLDLEKSENNSIVIVWATWCTHCVRLFMGIKEQKKDSLIHKYRIIGLSVDESKEKFETEIKKQNGHVFARNLWLKNHKNLPWNKIPTIFIYGKSGNLSQIIEGNGNVNELLRQLQKKHK
jgi:hypothetical protein